MIPKAHYQVTLKRNKNVDDREYELAKQIHLQYAENNNETRSTVISLIVSLLAVFGAYGYIFLHAGLWSAKNFGCLYVVDHEVENFSIEVLLLTTVACLIVIFIMQYICIYEGSTRRYDQFAAQNIRHKYGLEEGILPETYQAHGQNRNSFIPGIYNKFIKILDAITYSLIGATFLKVFYTSGWAWDKTTIVSFAILVATICYILIKKQTIISQKYCYYKRLEQRFSMYNSIK